VYSDTVPRTQIYLGDAELELLDQAAEATGASRSALIRRAVRDVFGQRTPAERLRALEHTAGSWQRSTVSGAAYVDVIRGDLNARLAGRGLD
jgi:hypothetical protein